jgi:ABC-type branched-subunit amino acid transport system substrate-binding protein
MKLQLRDALVVLAIIAAVVAQGMYVFPPEVRIAGLFPVTGINAKLGGEAEAASRIAVEKINSEGVIRANTSFLFSSFDTGSSEEVSVPSFPLLFTFLWC